MSQDIELGVTARDQMTDFQGTVTRVTDHITGCRRVELTGGGNEDVTGESEFYYDAQLDVVKERDDEYDDPVTDVDLELGQRVQDDITGFEGVVTAIAYELLNCPRICVQPTEGGDGDGSPEVEWLDEPRLSVVGDGVVDEYSDLDESEVTAETGAVTEDFGTRPRPS